MTTTPTITIYVRHSAGCKYEGDEFAKRCDCRKWLRWTQDGTRQRRKADTRSWAEAERVKRDTEDELTGKASASEALGTKNIRAAIEVFIADKTVENLSPDLITKYTLHLGRLASFCEGRGVYTVGGIDRELITGFCSGWPAQYPSTITRAKLRERYKSFMNYCFEAQWLARVPAWPKIKMDAPPTMPLTAKEYERLLDAVFVIVKAPVDAVVPNQTYEYWTKRVRGLFLLMRYSGLAIMDALTLKRAELIERGGVYRVTTSRQKTGVDVSVPIPPEIAEELLAIPNDNKSYFFWSGKGTRKAIVGNWGKRFIVPAFEEAKIVGKGNMRSHRLRDTFAVDLLEKGVPLEEVSKLLGHSSIKTTEKSYAAWVQGRQDRLDALVVATWAVELKPKRRNAEV